MESRADWSRRKSYLYSTSIEFDHVEAYIHAIVENSVCDLLVPVQVVVRALTLEFDLLKDPLRLPKLWSWLVYGELSPPRLPLEGVLANTPAAATRLRQFCEKRCFLQSQPNTRSRPRLVEKGNASVQAKHRPVRFYGDPITPPELPGQLHGEQLRSQPSLVEKGNSSVRTDQNLVPSLGDPAKSLWAEKLGQQHLEQRRESKGQSSKELLGIDSDSIIDGFSTLPSSILAPDSYARMVEERQRASEQRSDSREKPSKDAIGVNSVSISQGSSRLPPSGLTPDHSEMILQETPMHRQLMRELDNRKPIIEESLASSRQLIKEGPLGLGGIPVSATRGSRDLLLSPRTQPEPQPSLESGQHNIRHKPSPEKQDDCSSIEDFPDDVPRSAVHCWQNYPYASASTGRQSTPSFAQIAAKESPLKLQSFEGSKKRKWRVTFKQTPLFPPMEPANGSILSRKSPSPALETPCPTGGKKCNALETQMQERPTHLGARDASYYIANVEPSVSAEKTSTTQLLLRTIDFDQRPQLSQPLGTPFESRAKIKTSRTSPAARNSPKPGLLSKKRLAKDDQVAQKQSETVEIDYSQVRNDKSYHVVAGVPSEKAVVQTVGKPSPTGLANTASSCQPKRASHFANEDLSRRDDAELGNSAAQGEVNASWASVQKLCKENTRNGGGPSSQRRQAIQNSRQISTSAASVLPPASSGDTSSNQNSPNHFPPKLAPPKSAAGPPIPSLLVSAPNTISSHTPAPNPSSFDTSPDKASSYAGNDLDAMTNRKKPRKVAAGGIPPTLPPSVEEAYRKKSIELKRRMAEVEQSNDSFRLRKTRLLRGIRKMRLERTILLDILGKRMRKNGANGVYDSDSEVSSEGPPTPHDKPLRSKRGHRRPMASPPPGLPSQLSGPIAAASIQQPLPAFQSPYAPRHETSLRGLQPNGLPPMQPHRRSLPLQNFYPSQESQISLALSAFDFFVEENFLNRPEVIQQYQTQEDLEVAARSAWQGMTPGQVETWMATYNERLAAWRAAMHDFAQQRGEQPRGSLRGGVMDEEMADREEVEREDELERRREEYDRVQDMERAQELEMRRDEGRSGRPMSGGFTSING